MACAASIISKMSSASESSSAATGLNPAAAAAAVGAYVPAEDQAGAGPPIPPKGLATNDGGAGANPAEDEEVDGKVPEEDEDAAANRLAAVEGSAAGTGARDCKDAIIWALKTSICCWR